MGKPITAALATLLAATPALGQGQAKEKQVEVLRAVEQLFAGMLGRDSAKVASALDANARFTLLRPGPGGGWQVVVLPGAQFLQLALNPGNPPAEERIRNPVVHVDGNLATVWAEYQVLVNGSLSHCGTDAFDLVQLGGGWKILNVSDTFRQEGCGAPWPKP
jgi:hypothetical protein